MFMKCIKFENCRFHDAIIKYIDYEKGELILYIDYIGLNENSLILKTKVEEYDFSFLYCKQYPFFNRIVFRGKEISLKQLKCYFRKGFVLEIVDFLTSKDSDLAVFECFLSPCCSKAGVYKKIRIEARSESFFISVKEKSANE